MRVTSDLSTVKPFSVIPKEIYTARIAKVEATMPDGQGGVKALASKQGNLMFTLGWKVEGGEQDGREVNFDSVVYSGTIGTGANKGKPITPYRYAELIEALSLPWWCGNCNAGPRAVNFDRGNGTDGHEKGALVCPDCHQLAKADIETDDLMGQRCRIAVDTDTYTKSDGTTQTKNVIKSYLPLG